MEPFEICLCEKDEISYQVSVDATAEDQNTGLNEDKIFFDNKDKVCSLFHTFTFHIMDLQWVLIL